MEECVREWFDLNKPSPYMLFSAVVLQPDLVPAITHKDGTARVQTVNEKQNFKLYKLLEAFHSKSQVPMLLNTSFNKAGQPIVETPKDAFETFKKMKLDILVMENFYIRKKED